MVGDFLYVIELFYDTFAQAALYPLFRYPDSFFIRNPDTGLSDL